MVGQLKYGLESVSCHKQGIEAFTKCRKSRGLMKFIGYKTRMGYFIGKRKLRSKIKRGTGLPPHC